jgi:hypothetical protein
MEARHDLSVTAADRIAAAQEHYDEMLKIERLVARLHQAGQIDPLAWMDAQYRRLEAESWLAQAPSR